VNFGTIGIIYRIIEEKIIVFVITVGKLDKSEVYKISGKRLADA